MTKGIVSFTTNPYVFTTLDRAPDHFGRDVGVRPDQCCYFLVKAEPGTDIPTLCARIRAPRAGAGRLRPARPTAGCAWSSG